MIKTTIRDKVRKTLKKAHELGTEIASGLRLSMSDDARIIYLQALINDYVQDLLLVKSLTDEIEYNVSKGLRPAEEIRYLDSLEDTLDLILDSYKKVEQQRWEDNIFTRTNFTLALSYARHDDTYTRLNNDNLDETGKSLVSELIECVRECHYAFFDKSDMIADLAGQLFVNEVDRDQYPTIASLISEKGPEEELNSTPIHSQTQEPLSIQIEPQPLKEKEEPEDLNLSVKLLIAAQSGLLTGDFHKLPQEKQYAVLAELFSKSRGNVKNAVVALTGNTNSDKNPRNLPSAVEKANEIIHEKGLGIPLVKGRKES